MSSPQEVCAKLYGGKPQDWKIIDDLEGEISIDELQETYNIALEEINKLNNDNNKLRKKIKELKE